MWCQTTSTSASFGSGEVCLESDDPTRFVVWIPEGDLMTAARLDTPTHPRGVATMSTGPRLVTAGSEFITVPSERRDALRAPYSLPVTAWLLSDCGCVVIISAMGMGNARIDAAIAVGRVQSRWSRALVLEKRRPYDGERAHHPRSTDATYVELNAHGRRIRPDFEELDRRGLHLDHS